MKIRKLKVHFPNYAKTIFKTVYKLVVIKIYLSTFITNDFDYQNIFLIIY